MTGLAIGWTAVDWADTARAIPGAAEHQLFPHVVSFAALSALLRGDLEGGAALVAMAEDAQRALGTRHLWVHDEPWRCSPSSGATSTGPGTTRRLGSTGPAPPATRSRSSTR